MKEGPKFLHEDKIKEKAVKWGAAAREQELLTGFGYIVDRDSNWRGDSIEALHGVSFIRDIIPTLIKKKKEGEKVNILDVGTGATRFTNEIRETFRDKVRVYSTGLSKKAVKKHWDVYDGFKPQLHPDDLKWRSILELSDFPEFDLIIDTFGEFYYMNGYKKVSSGDLNKFYELAAQYIKAAIKKLKPGGILSISPIDLKTDSDLENSVLVDQLRMDKSLRISFFEKDRFTAIRIEKVE